MDIILEEDRNIHNVFPGFIFNSNIHYAICYESVISTL